MESVNKTPADIYRDFTTALEGLACEMKHTSLVMAELNKIYKGLLQANKQYHTGIKPKFNNRTRKKARPTRLQRRAKRQNKWRK